MSQKIKLEIIDEKVKVTTPYNAEFVQKCRNMRGKFKNNAWYIDDSLIDDIRDAMIKIYGTTGELPVEYCSLRIKDYTASEPQGPVVLFGRTIARASGRDSGARMGDDIVFISGSYNSGGSVKNWTTRVEDATFEIKNFPVPATEKEEVQKAIADGWCEIKKSQKKRPKEEIVAEIETLKERIYKLENELENQ